MRASPDCWRQEIEPGRPARGDRPGKTTAAGPRDGTREHTARRTTAAPELLVFRPSLARAILGALLLSGLAGCFEQLPPNVLLVIIDTLRADHLHGYGYYRETSPTLDRLIRNGVRFDTAVSNSSWSAPSHATIITGVSTHRHRVLDFNDGIEESIEPLSLVLKKRGYATGLFSTHYGLHTTVLRMGAGTDTKLVLRNEQDAEILPAAADWADKQRQPYLLYIVLMGPHAPYTKYPKAYDRTYFLDQPPGGKKRFPFTSSTWVGEGGIPRSVQLDNRHDLGFYVNRYDRAILFTDALLGDFLEEMEGRGLLDNTVIAVTSDHGEGLGEHSCFAHELYLYDFLIRVPLIIVAPGQIPAGLTWKPMVPLVDVTPTILGLTGNPVPDWMEGRDLSPHLRAGRPAADTVIAVGSYRHRGYDRYSVRSDRYKLVYDSVNDSEELFDLEADASESTNLLDPRAPDFPDEAYRELKDIMRTHLADHATLEPQHYRGELTKEARDELKSLGYVEDD